jgi:hypothetical protein
VPAALVTTAADLIRHGSLCCVGRVTARTRRISVYSNCVVHAFKAWTQQQ